MKFSALNKEASSNSSFSTPSSKRGRPTQEAQESICLKLYHDAMKHQQEGKWREAKSLYCEILESELMEEACGSSAMSPSCLPSSSTIARLKFLIYKNMASIAKEQGDLSAAVDACIEATSVDTTDITVWSQLASLASSLGNLLLARKALECALCCQANHWPAIENLCTVLFALQDYTGLVYLKQIVMEQPDILYRHHLHQLQIHMMTEHLEARDIFLEEADVLYRRREALNGVEALRNPILPPRKLTTPTMYCLATCLYSLYKHCRDLSSRQSHFLVPIDFSTFIDANSSIPALSPTGKGSPSSEVLEELTLSKMSGEVLGKEGSSVEEGKVGSVRREAKRKLLDGLEAFVPKRRSSRMMTRRKEKEHKNYFDMLSKYLPHWLVLNELPNISELSPLKELRPTDEEERLLSEQRLAVAALVKSTPYLAEAEEVRKFVREMEGNSGIIQILFNFICFLSLRYDNKWCAQPAPLVRMFVDVYKCLHQHLSFPSALCSPVEAQEERFQQVAMVALCYVEMYIDTYKQKINSHDSTWSACPNFRDCLAFAQHCSGLVGVAPLGKVRYTLRVQWCLGKLYQLTRQQDAAIKAYTMCRDLLQVFCVEEEGPRTLLVYLPNLLNGPIISLDHVTERLRDLERSISLKDMEQLFLQNKYAAMVDRLLPVLYHTASIPSEFLLGTKAQGSEVTSLSLLLDSLFFLNQHHSCLETAVHGALQLLQHQFYGNDLWIAAIKNTFRVIGNCLENGVALETVKMEAGVRLLKQLMVCVLKVMDSVYDMAENSDLFLTMPICLPWKIFYIVISSDWRARVSMEETDVIRVGSDLQALSTGCYTTTTTTIGEEPVAEMGATLKGKEAASSLEEMEISGNENDEQELVLCTPPPSPVPAASSPYSPLPAASNPCSPPVPAASKCFHLVPAASSPCSPPVPAASSPCSPPVPAASSPCSPPVPAASTYSPVPADFNPCSPPVPAAFSPCSPLGPAAFSPCSPLGPAAFSPCSPPVPAAFSPNSPPVPAASSPCSPVSAASTCSPVPAASTCSPVPASFSPCSPPVPAASTCSPVPAASTCSPVPAAPICSPPVPAASTCSPVPAASTCSPVPASFSPCSPPVPAASTCSPVPAASTCSPVPAASTCSPPVPAASTCSPVPASFSPCSPPVPAASTCSPVPASFSPCSPPVPAASTCSPVPASFSPCSPPVPAASTCSPVPAASTCSPVPASFSPCSPPVPAASTCSPVPASFSPCSPPVPAASTCSPVPAASTCSPVPASFSPCSPPVPATSSSCSLPVPASSTLCSPPVLAASSWCSPSAPPQPVLASGSCKTACHSSSFSVNTCFSSSSFVHPRGSCPSSKEVLIPFLEFLLEAHRHLGQMGWCCKQGGVFLMQSVQALRKELTILTRLPAKQRDLLLQELEQCYYCLYGHPNKKAKVRGLLDHSTEQIPLTWESAMMLIEHYHPVPLPSIDDNKSPQVTAEVISLYKRVVEVLPDHGKVFNKEELEQFIEGQSEALSTPQPPHQDSSIISDVYFILADDALNCMENHKAIRYYLETICYLPDRFDSWAGLALARSRIIMDKLNQRDSKSGMEKYICKHYVATITCFKKAVSLNTKHCSIIEKFGFFCYTVQSFVSQLLHQPSLYLASGVQPWASAMHREMLTQAEQCFNEALGLEGTRYAEPWIYHWMLGKVGRKLQAPVKHIMKNFVKSARTLFQDGAIYPGLVELSSKNHSLEAIEVHYQLHSSALKFLIPFHHNSSPSQDQEGKRLAVEEAIAEALMHLSDMPMSSQSYPPLWVWVREVIRSASREEMDMGESCLGDTRVDLDIANKTDALEIDDEDPIVSSDRSHDQSCDVMGGVATSQEEIGISSSWDYVSLLQLCLYGVAVCAVRFPAFFKPVYRMAATLLALGLPQHARALLLGPLPPQLLQCQDKLQPLFVLRTNIFTNMWQVPCDEVNRPGSFSSHARHIVELLVKVLVELREAKTLLHLAQLLKSRPDTNKQYLRDNERLAMHEKIVRDCVKVLVEVSKKINMSSSEALRIKSVVASVRNMASKLESSLLKDLDGVLEHIQVHIILSHEELPITPGTTPTVQN